VSRAIVDQVDRIYVINLPERVDRRREMEQELARVGVAADAAKLTWFPAVRPSDRGVFPSIGARGCFLSHLQVLRSARDAKLSRILILEDDVDFEPDFPSRFAQAMDQLERQPWCVFYGTYRLEEPLPHTLAPLAKIEPSLRVSTTQFMVIQGPTIADLVGYFESMLSRPEGHPDGGPMHVDGAYSWFRNAYPDRQTFLATPVIVHERPSRTDIHDLGWQDRWPIVKDVARMWRRLRWRSSLRKRSEQAS
jgi:glycosyl transferase, family 25